MKTGPKMAPKWTVLETTAPARWKLGLYIWRDTGEWRLRLYRPWKRERLIEVQSTDLLTAVYILGIGANWWKGFDGPTGSTSNKANQQSK